jgi:hypothetical protein
VLGKAVLGKHSQRGRDRRRAQPRRPRHLGAAGPRVPESLVHEPGRTAKDQEHRMDRLDAGCR